MKIAANSALLLIDLQVAIRDPRWAADGVQNHPDAEANAARLLGVWREMGLPVIHVRHDSREADSPYRPGQAGNSFLPAFVPMAGEPVIPKQVNSAFIGTVLEKYLQNEGIRTIFVAGVITNNSVEATVRMAGNLGFDTYLVEDACYTFARRDFAGRLRTAEEVHAMSLANLAGEYCRVVTTAAVIESPPS